MLWNIHETCCITQQQETTKHSILKTLENLLSVTLDTGDSFCKRLKYHDLTGNLSTIPHEWYHDTLFESVYMERPPYKYTRIYSTSFLCFLCIKPVLLADDVVMFLFARSNRNATNCMLFCWRSGNVWTKMSCSRKTHRNCRALYVPELTSLYR